MNLDREVVYAIQDSSPNAEEVELATPLDLDNERLRIEMEDHIRHHQGQRDYINFLKDQCRRDYGNNVKFCDRHDVFVADYSQNMDLPHFGTDQPGDTYYYSPLSIFVFGVVNFATNMMNAFVYDEGEAKKGGDSVVSLLWKSLKMAGIIEEVEKGNGPGKNVISI